MIATEPPASAPLLPLDRRALLKGGLLGAGLAAAPLSAQIGERGFTSGIASGEPGATSVLLWTRYVGGAETKAALGNRRFARFREGLGGWRRRRLARARFLLQAGNSHRARDPAAWYYFRFVAPDGTQSDIGRTKTLPQGQTDRFRMAVFSCSNIGFGWFNAYAHAAAADAFDCTFHLGDYFYEYAPGTYPSAKETVRPVEPQHELIALTDYRARYAQYRRDPDLRRLHQLYPMIAVWDDHETANDSWEGGAENHQPATEGPWSVRKAAAIRAHSEWMPVSDADWASYDIGDLATLFRLETRLTARAQQFDLAKIMAGKTAPGEAEAALAAFRDGAWRDPARNMIGADQQAWLGAGLKTSKREGKVWQVLVQQVVMASLRAPVAIAEQAGGNIPDYVLVRLKAAAMASRAGLPMNMDAWDGYPAARERVFDAAQAADSNLIVLAGDSHNAWASDLASGGKPVGVEFAGQSVTSPGFESFLPQIPPERMAAALREENPALKFTDTAQRGYMAVELTPGAATCEYRFVTSVRQRGASLAGTHTVTSLPGRRTLVT